jgi:hypothetical protein
MTNIYHEPDAARIVADLRERLLKWLPTTTRVVTTFPPLAPDGTPYGKGARRHHVDADGKRGREYVRRVRSVSPFYL